MPPEGRSLLWYPQHLTHLTHLTVRAQAVQLESRKDLSQERERKLSIRSVGSNTHKSREMTFQLPKVSDFPEREDPDREDEAH